MALRAFLGIVWNARKSKKRDERTISKVSVLLERNRRGESLSEKEHKLLTTALTLRADLENVLAIAGWLPPLDQRTLDGLRRALGDNTFPAASDPKLDTSTSG